MENFSEYLRKQRQERKIRLSDVAIQTRISMKFLEAIEAGNLEILPETYIRAFIRDYAKAVGLDPDDAIKKYDLHVESLKAVTQQREIQPPKQSGGKQVSLTQAQKIAAGGIGVVILAILSYLAFSPNKKPPVDLSTTYDNTEVIDQKKFDSAYTAATTPKIEKVDSSRLVLSADDTVWVNLVVDEGRTYDLLMRPGNRLTFWGKRKFNMTIGNAGGLTIVLNGHQYPPLGGSGVVIRNVTILKDGTIKK